MWLQLSSALRQLVHKEYRFYSDDIPIKKFDHFFFTIIETTCRKSTETGFAFTKFKFAVGIVFLADNTYLRFGNSWVFIVDFSLNK